MNPEPYKLDTADRAELCRRVDLRAVLAADGVDVKRNGATYLCRLRTEKTASCHIYPPGVGRKGAAGWTLHDFGDGWDGDALAYLVDKRGLPFVDAVRELCRLAGWTPPNMPESLQRGRAGAAVAANLRPAGVKPPARPQSAPEPPRMDAAEQFAAACALVDAVKDLYPNAADLGRAYLAGRGCLPAGWAGGAWVLTGDACRTLAAYLATGPNAGLLKRARILKPADTAEPLRLGWWGDVCLLACYGADGCLAYFTARRLDWKAGDGAKYIHQGTAGGAAKVPYNLPALYHVAGRAPWWNMKPAKDKAGDVLLVEGPLDALGAACLGWAAVSPQLGRLQAHDYADQHGDAARMLTPHLPALRDVRRVLVVPDADQGDQGAKGEAMAARLVGWLRFSGVKTELKTLADLCAPADCKDFADWAKKIKGKP